MVSWSYLCSVIGDLGGASALRHAVAAPVLQDPQPVLLLWEPAGTPSTPLALQTFMAAAVQDTATRAIYQQSTRAR